MRNIKDEKIPFREKHRAQRENLAEGEKYDRDKRIAACLFPTMAYSDADQILLYKSLPSEISTTEIFERTKTDGKRCFFPRSLDFGMMYFHEVSDFSEMKKGKFGLLEPTDSAPLYTPMARDICIVPALSYDREGYRLGYGGGYYDRFLSSFPGTKIGICYSENIEKRLPRGRYDVCVDMLLTEKGIYRLKR